MKRGFLFGLTWFLILGAVGTGVGVLGSISQIVDAGAHGRVYSGGDPVIYLAMAVLFGWLSRKAMRAAKVAPPHLTRLHGFVGWLGGFSPYIALVAFSLWAAFVYQPAE